MSEQRIALRKNTSLKGEISLETGGTIACIVSNVSSSGAKLNVAHSASLPSSFHLRAPDLELDVQAKVIWRKDEQVGVRFPLTGPTA